MIDDAELDRLIGDCAERVWNRVFTLWDRTGSPAAVGTVMSLVMCRFLEAVQEAGHARLPDRQRFIDEALEIHTGAVRKGMEVLAERQPRAKRQ